jgi:hypothetical protein
MSFSLRLPGLVHLASVIGKQRGGVPVDAVSRGEFDCDARMVLLEVVAARSLHDFLPIEP